MKSIQILSLTLLFFLAIPVFSSDFGIKNIAIGDIKVIITTKLSDEYLKNNFDSIEKNANQIFSPLEIDYGGQKFILDNERIKELSNFRKIFGRCTNYFNIKIEHPDFDGDSIEDAVAHIYCNHEGSSQIELLFIASSNLRKAWLYSQSAGGNGFWAGSNIPLPKIEYPYAILEELDFMPNYNILCPQDSNKNEDECELLHPEAIGYVFIRSWDGNGFSYKPQPEFYKVLLLRVQDAIKTARTNFIKNMYQRILLDFEEAGNGRDISEITKKSSMWQEIKVFDRVDEIKSE